IYMLKSHTELSLSLAGVLFTQGANMLNPYQSCSLIQSKIITSKLLRQAGTPAPDSWVTGDLSMAKSLLEKHPLIIKPHMGHRGAGVHLCKTPEDIDKIPPPATPMIVQEAIPGRGTPRRDHRRDSQDLTTRRRGLRPRSLRPRHHRKRPRAIRGGRQLLPRLQGRPERRRVDRRLH